MASNSRQHPDDANAIVAFEQETHNMAAAVATKFRTPTRNTSEEERSRTRRRMGQRKLYNNSSSRNSTSLATLLVLFALSSMALPTARSATFFYGATDESDGDDAMNDAEQGQLDSARALAMAENAAAVHHHAHAHAHAATSNSDVADEEEDTRLSKHELQAVYKFCEILPQLQQQGFIPENKHARDLCKKLVDMLKPMFRKRTRSSARQGALPMPSRARRHVAALLLQQAQQTLTNQQAH